MTPHNSVNLQSLNSQLDKFKSATKNGTGVTLRWSSNIIGNDEINFSHLTIIDKSQIFVNALQIILQLM